MNSSLANARFSAITLGQQVDMWLLQIPNFTGQTSYIPGYRSQVLESEKLENTDKKTKMEMKFHEKSRTL